jgi:(p)ppGpp synthase/HD superfamily hydrolase
MHLVEKAKAFAKERHASQTRKYSVEPYAQHLRSVVQLLDGYGITAQPVLAAAWLHDTVEDTHTTMEEILNEFGSEVAELVYWMTDPEEGDQETRSRMIAWRLGRAPWEAKMLKLVDIIDNCRNASIHDGEVATAYMAEKRHVLN